jgi:CheY-like chemotaxis protein
VVDDNEGMRALIERMLRNDGHLLQYAVDGLSALSLLETKPFDLVITDLHMPDMDGLELIRALTTKAHSTPVVVLSGADGARPGSLLRAAQAFGALAVLAKPVSVAALREMVRVVLAGERPALTSGQSI